METIDEPTVSQQFLPALTIEQFRALPRHEQRRAIARDALDQIALKRLLPGTGNYLLTSIFTVSEVGTELRDVLLARQSCTVCGLGACFVSAVRLDDNLTVNRQYPFNRCTESRMCFDDGGFGEKLGEFFSPEQLDLIEAAFEVTDVHLRVLDSEPYQFQHDENETISDFTDRLVKYQQSDVGRAIQFGERYDDE